MQYRIKLWQAFAAVSFSVLTIPVLAHAQSRYEILGRFTGDYTETSPSVRSHSRWWPPDRHVGAGVSVLGDEQLPGSGQMADTDRTGTTGPSGTRSFSTNTGPVSSTARVAKPAGDYAFTAVDRGLAARVRQALNGDPSLPVTNENVHLKVISGTVTLEGWVPSRWAKREIGAKVRELSGVRGVDNRLLVARYSPLSAQEE